MVANHTDCAMDIQQAMEKPMEMVKEYPVVSTMLLFGVGVGVGVLLSQALPQMTACTETRTMSEKLAKQVYEAVSKVIPDSLVRQMNG